MDIVPKPDSRKRIPGGMESSMPDSSFIRKPVVSGTFYPDKPDQLRVLVESLLNFSPAPDKREKPAGMLLPHAGYAYSGPVTGYTLSRVFGENASLPDTIILLGPSHRSHARGIFVWPEGAWQTPIGDVPINQELRQRILESSTVFKADIVPHEQEHSLEVLLPFLLALNPYVRIVPISVSEYDIATLQKAGIALAAEIMGKDVFILVSSDMSHYISQSAAQRQDAMALARIEALDPAGLYKTVIQNKISMCGVLPAVLALYVLKTMGKKCSETVCYDNSGRVTGDTEQVVGYAGVLLGL